MTAVEPRPAVTLLVAAVRAASLPGPCWVLTAPLGRIALVADAESGPVFVGAFSRANLSDATGLRLLELHPDTVQMPRYTGGGSQWAWTPATVGRQIRVTGGGQ